MKQKIIDLFEQYPYNAGQKLKKQPEMMEWVKHNSVNENAITIAEKAYSAINQDTGICEYGNFKKFLNFPNGYSGCRSNCQCARKKAAQTNLERYGVENPFQSPEIKEKSKQTNLDRLGVDYPSQSPLVREKSKQTNRDKLGVDYPSQSPLVREKAKQTNLDRLGVDYPSQSPLVREKSKQTNRDKLGVDHPRQSLMAMDSLHILNDKTQLEHLLKTNTFWNIGKKLNVSDCTVARYAYKYGLSSPNIKSQPEIEIYQFLTENGIKFEQNVRTLISPKELDFYLPDFHLAIEFNGLYWHSDRFVDENYHKTKSSMCSSLGIHLLHIFEDEWHKSSSVIKKKILHLCQKTPRVVVGARELSISETTKLEISKFIDSNHVQGMPPNATHYLKVTHHEKIIAAILLKKTSTQIVDMTRFCTDQQGTYPGLMSKVISFIKKTYTYRELITFADLRFSNGDVYRKSGFTEVKRLAPDYFYVVGGTRFHKFNFRKNIIAKKFSIDAEGKTEREMAGSAGLLRIYDCGKIKYSISLVIEK